ncbi:MAG: T9SS type A sorting domain-containing protein [Saprospiraceae bacterium]|nr:T9SS type A sorting domain-containing protein [Saprospiraceae bacterium]
MKGFTMQTLMLTVFSVTFLQSQNHWSYVYNNANYSIPGKIDLQGKSPVVAGINSMGRVAGSSGAFFTDSTVVVDWQVENFSRYQDGWKGFSSYAVYDIYEFICIQPFPPNESLTDCVILEEVQYFPEDVIQTRQVLGMDMVVDDDSFYVLLNPLLQQREFSSIVKFEADTGFRNIRYFDQLVKGIFMKDKNLHTVLDSAIVCCGLEQNTIVYESASPIIMARQADTLTYLTTLDHELVILDRSWNPITVHELGEDLQVTDLFVTDSSYGLSTFSGEDLTFWINRGGKFEIFEVSSSEINPERMKFAFDTGRLYILSHDLYGASTLFSYVLENIPLAQPDYGVSLDALTVSNFNVDSQHYIIHGDVTIQVTNQGQRSLSYFLLEIDTDPGWEGHTDVIINEWSAGLSPGESAEFTYEGISFNFAIQGQDTHFTGRLRAPDRRFEQDTSDNVFSQSILVTNVSKVVEGGHLSIQPNPTEGHLEIISKVPLNQLTIYNAIGVQVRTRRLPHSPDHRIDFQLDDGLYFVVLLDEKGRKHVRKLMIKK